VICCLFHQRTADVKKDRFDVRVQKERILSYRKVKNW